MICFSTVDSKVAIVQDRCCFHLSVFVPGMTCLCESGVRSHRPILHSS